MRATIESSELYRGRDATANAAVRNVMEKQRRIRRAERNRRNSNVLEGETKKEVKEKRWMEENSNGFQIAELNRQISFYMDRRRAGEITKETFDRLTRPYRLEMRRLTKASLTTVFEKNLGARGIVTIR